MDGRIIDNEKNIAALRFLLLNFKGVYSRGDPEMSALIDESRKMYLPLKPFTKRKKFLGLEIDVLEELRESLLQLKNVLIKEKKLLPQEERSSCVNED